MLYDSLADTLRGAHYNIKTRQSVRTKGSGMSNPARWLSFFALTAFCSHMTPVTAAQAAHCKLETLAAVDIAVRDPGPLVPATVDGHPVWLPPASMIAFPARP